MINLNSVSKKHVENVSKKFVFRFKCNHPTHSKRLFAYSFNLYVSYVFKIHFPISFTGVYLHFWILFMPHFDFPPAITISIITSETFSTISHFESVTKSLKIEISKQFQSTSKEHLLVFLVEKICNLNKRSAE